MQVTKLPIPQAVMNEFPHIRIAFGESDEYSFVFDKNITIYGKGCLALPSYYLHTSAFIHSPTHPRCRPPGLQARFPRHLLLHRQLHTQLVTPPS